MTKSLGTPGRAGRVPEKIDEQLAKTNAQLAKADAKLDRMRDSEVSQTTKVRLPKNFFTTPSNTIRCWSESNLILYSGMSLVPPKRAMKNTISCSSTLTLLYHRGQVPSTPQGHRNTHQTQGRQLPTTAPTVSRFSTSPRIGELLH